MKKTCAKLFSTALYMFSWVTYLMYISDVFYGIPGYYFENLSYYRVILIMPLILAISFFLDHEVKDISDLILLGSIYIVLFPLIYLSFPDLILSIIVAIGTLFIIILDRLLKSVSFTKRRKVLSFVKYKHWKFFLLIMMFVILFWKFIGFKLSLNYEFSLYEIRSEFKKSFSGLSVYVLILSEYFIIPLCIYSFFKVNRTIFKILFLVIGFLFTIQVFLNSAIKSSLFIIPFLILGYLFFKKRKSFNFSNFLFISSLLLILFIHINMGNIIGYLVNHSLRRFIISPPVNAYYHFLYTIEYYGWINIGNRKDMGNLISRAYYCTDGNAPSGLLADAFSRFGTLGLLIFPYVFSIFLTVLRGLTKNLELSEQFVLFGYYIYVLSNTSFLTSQITYGLLWMILTVYFLNKKFIVNSRYSND